MILSIEFKEGALVFSEEELDTKEMQRILEAFKTPGCHRVSLVTDNGHYYILNIDQIEFMELYKEDA